MAYKPEYYPGRQPGKRRFNFSRLFSTVVGLALIWHFTLYLGMRERYQGMRINPITNVIHVPYGMQAPGGPIPGVDKGRLGRVHREVLEAEVQTYAKDMMDVYVYLVPWTVHFDTPEEQGPSAQ